jgi:glycosyltransferase involved in cell wall biosynthesis
MMLRVLTLATLFPDITRPRLGPFVERQTLGLATHSNVELQVVAPIGLPPFPLSLHRHYRDFSNVPKMEDWNGLSVHRPRYMHLPGTKGRFDAGALAGRLTPLLTEIRRTFAFDIIDAEFFFPDGPAAITLGAHFGVPVSIKARGADIHFWGHQAPTADQVRLAGQSADGLLAVSKALKDDMVRIGMPSDRISVHYTGVDLEKFTVQDRAVAKAALGISSKLIICVGALIPRKGQSLVIDALPHLSDTQLVLIGEGEDRARLSQQAEALGVEDRVTFTGNLPHEEIAAWLSAADVMALPSASEGLANAWVEALACGTPIVITNAGGAREVLTDDSAGRIVGRTASGVLLGLQSVFSNPPSRAACRQIAERFKWERNTEALVRHLSLLVGE